MMLQTGNMILQLGGLRGMEWIILIVIVVVLLFGAKKLPELARSMGRATGEFQRGQLEIQHEISQAKLNSPSSSEPSDETEKLIRAAKELGINTVGKTKDELKEEISHAMMR